MAITAALWIKLQAHSDNVHMQTGRLHNFSLPISLLTFALKQLTKVFFM